MRPPRRVIAGRVARSLAALWLLGRGLPGRAQPAPAGDARAWLMRMHAAANERNYQGTMVFSAGGVVSSSRVAHFHEGGQFYERIEALDGRMHRIYRHNDQVATLWPQSRVAVIEQREPLATPSPLLPPLEPRALERYELGALGSERLAGRDARVFLLSPLDEFRFAQRIWADQATGLMLRADVLGPKQELLESSAFSEVEIGIRPQPESVLQPMKKLDGYRVVRPQAVRTSFEAEGWALPAAPVAGFRLASCARRELEADGVDAAPGSAAHPVLQAVFSDGLTHVSLFLETFDPARHRKPMHTRIGATHTLMQRQADQWWLTAMGDVPPATLRQFAAALERRR